MKTGKLIDEIAEKLKAEGYHLSSSKVEAYEGNGGALHVYFRPLRGDEP